jgi:hypothetical protein
MLKSIEAVFDGKVFRPAEEVELEANTRVRLIFETLLSDHAQHLSFLELASQLKLDGPEDWSSKLDEYLYVMPDSNGS